MSKPKLSSVTDQVAELLRFGIAERRWEGTLPGRLRLAEELGCSHWTVDAAIEQLTKEGLLVSQGGRRPRRIVFSGHSIQPVSMRVQILLYEKADGKIDYLLELLYMLQDAGYDAIFARQTLHDLGMSVERVSRFVQKTQADAWIVVAGSQDVLEWFASQSTPAFALFGRLIEVPLAGTSPNKVRTYAEVVDQLVGLGHRRIVYLTREDRRKPTPGFLEQCFLNRLEKHGIQTSSYNLPDWEESPEGLQRLLMLLFQHTPPTAMLIDGANLFAATRDYLATRGILAPNNVSLICSDPDSTFDWCLPAVAHMAWDYRPLIRRVVKWTENISRGKDDRRKSSHKTRLILGGTIGPASTLLK